VRSILRSTLALLMLAAIPFSPSPALAEWLRGGTPVHVGPLTQRDPTLAPDGLGGMFVAWIHYDVSPELFVKRVTGDGDLAPDWPAEGLRLDVTLRAATTFGNLRMVPDTLGGVYVMWAEVSGFDFSTLYRPKLQHVLANGTTDPAWPDTGLVPLPQQSPGVGMSLAADGFNGVLMLWTTSDHLGPSTMHRVQRVTAAGTPAPGWPDSGFVIGPGETPRLVPDGSGGAIVAWRGLDKMLALHVPSVGGGPDWSGVELRDQGGPGSMRWAVTDGAGGAYVLMEDDDLFVQRLDANGATAPGWPPGGRTVVAGSNTSTMDADGSGGAYVVWESSPNDMSVLRLDPDGSDGDGWPAAGVSLGHGEVFYDLHASGAGVFIAWHTSGGERNIQVNRVGYDGTRPPGWDEDGVIVAPMPATQEFPRIVSDGAGGALVAWTDYRNSFATETDIYAARILPDATVGIVASLTTAEATSERVRLVWWARDVHEVRVERALDGSGEAWQSMTTLVPDASRQVVFEDRAIVPGERYRYRLGLPDGSWAGEVSIEVPRTVTFALLGARPNPASRNAVLEYTLDREGEVRLDVLDVTGRLVSARSLPGTAGSHFVPLAPSRELPPGAYLVRISHEGRTDTARVVVVR
jgi:hypothetical protein